MATIPIFEQDLSLEYINPPTGYCVVSKNGDLYYVWVNGGGRHIVVEENGIYRILATSKKYNSIKELIDSLGLVCIQVETTKVNVICYHGHPQVNYFAEVRDPDNRLLLVRADFYSNETSELTMLRAGGNWVPGYPHVEFSDNQKLNEFLGTIDSLNMLNL